MNEHTEALQAALAQQSVVTWMGCLATGSIPLSPSPGWHAPGNRVPRVATDAVHANRAEEKRNRTRC